MTSVHTTNELLPDAEATALIVRLREELGHEPQLIQVAGKVGIEVNEQTAKTWPLLFARLDAIAAVEGEERMLAIWDASIEAAYARMKGLQ